MIEKDKIHGLLFINTLPETYSFALTKGIASGRPMLYTEIGAYKERLNNRGRFFATDNEDRVERFKDMLDFILVDKESKPCKVSTERITPPAFYKLFNFGKQTDNYAIYFPQFHALKENSETFYEGYHDMKNLEIANRETKDKYDYPLSGYYDLSEGMTVQSHIKQAKDYGLKGFGLYYYWFATNEVTGNNMVMNTVINKFFETDMKGFDVFFIWANESWTNNPAFENKISKKRVVNTYDSVSIKKNVKNLIPYFNHKNYKKVDNKPLFFVHHPWEMTESELSSLFQELNQQCKAVGFDGVYMVINNIGGCVGDYKTYTHTPNYKNGGDFITHNGTGNVIDYEKCVQSMIKDTKEDIKTVFYNFDNSIRFWNHKDKKITTKTINNNIENLKKMLFVQRNKYQGQLPILMFNAWNEWGEQMSLEPSKQKGDELLKTL